MTITNSKAISYKLFGQVVLMFLVYSALALLSALKFLPNDLLAQTLSYAQVSGFTHIMLNLMILTGLLAGGIYVISCQRRSEMLANEALLSVNYRAWTVLMIAAFLAGLSGQIEGRHLLELPVLLDISKVVLLVLFLYNIGISITQWSPFAIVWMIGMSLSVVCTVIGLIPQGDYVQDRILRSLAVNININVAYVLAAIALGFWLITRFSNVVQAWADEGIYTIAGLVSLAGGLVSIAPLYAFGASNIFGNIIVFLVPMLYLIYCGHSYRALKDRNPILTLSAHWYTLSVLLWLIGIGVIGALQSSPGIQQWTQGTRLTDLQYTLTALATLSMILGVINQGAAELRAQNQRVTGYMPFWFVGFGIIGGAVALGAAGIVQVYLERILSVGYLETQELLVPLYLFWIVGLFSVAIGAGIYALGFRARGVHQSRPADNDHLNTEHSS